MRRTAAALPWNLPRRSAAERTDRVAAGELFALRLNMTELSADRPHRWLRDRWGQRLEYVEEAKAIVCRPERFGDVVLARKVSCQLSSLRHSR